MGCTGSAGAEGWIARAWDLPGQRIALQRPHCVVATTACPPAHPNCGHHIQSNDVALSRRATAGASEMTRLVSSVVNSVAADAAVGSETAGEAHERMTQHRQGSPHRLRLTCERG